MKHQSVNTYDSWETAIAEMISDRLSCSYGDASGIIEANPFIMAQSWGLALTAEDTANKILAQSN